VWRDVMPSWEGPKLGVNYVNTPAEVIELRVNDIGQLFQSLDPFPFRERDLDKEAEEYIVSWARELSNDQPIKIIVHLPEREARSKAASELRKPLLAILAIAQIFCNAS
jgi:hypothetical protein